MTEEKSADKETNRLPKIQPFKIEEIHVFPAGRNRVATFAIKKRMKTPKDKKTKTLKFLHFCIKSNPENISFVEYINQGRKNTYLFPEGIEITAEKARELSAAFYVRSLNISENRSLSNSKQIRLTPEYKKELKKQSRKYQKWRIRNSLN